MIKYKAFYKYIGNNLDIYFKCKSKDVDEQYISCLFVLEYTNYIWDNRRPIDLDNITNNFYKISIYADILESNTYAGISNSDSSKTGNTLKYESVFKLCNFIKECNKESELWSSSVIKFETGCLIKGNRISVLINIITSTLLYWDDE